ncbi:conserved hypothetical protein [Anaeromyxobacter sp. K]|uniref:hypothetical protein n=1 Tax=Anaeromyxobacter sp. (strain K) TaxID=447217 RepID=UPI00015F943A|nr:hypothetical protein [Anaeromyxobacter sp. K]ACG75464.1 conserved hypothetical protein [Anaeromyxobacter sp. K]
MRALPVLAVALLAVLPPVLSGCGGQAACEVPAGCLRAERTGGSCGCAEWEVVDTQSVAVPYVVTDVQYQPFGAGSTFYIGRAWIPALGRYSDTAPGVNVRAAIRTSDGGERVARVGSVDPLYMERVTGTVLRTPPTASGAFELDPVDISDPATDVIQLWVNAAVTIDTTAAGEKIVHWTSRPGPDPARPDDAYQGLSVPVRTLQGGTTGLDWIDAYFAGLGPEGRAEIVAFDERVAGPPMSERYLWLESWVLGDREQTATLYQWTPCTDPEAFEVLAETAVPLPGGETFVLQYGVQADASCTPQSPGMYLEMTPGCETGYQMFVDRLSGKLMMLAAPYGTCTGR